MFKVKCPYCGFENKINVGLDYYIPKEVIIKTFKIEGEEV